MRSLLGLAVLSASCSLTDGLDPDPTVTFPEGEAMAFIILRDGPSADWLDAEALWSVIHPDLQAGTNKAEYLDCVLTNPERPEPSDPASAVPELEPSLFGIASYRADNPRDNVLIRDGVTYSVPDRRHDRNVEALVVRAEGPDGTTETTVFLAADGFVGTNPPDPCLPRADQVREQLQSTSTLGVAHLDNDLPELSGYQIVVALWRGDIQDDALVGGAGWWADDGGNGGDVIRPLNDGTIVLQTPLEKIAHPDPDEPDVRAEPAEPGDWVRQAFVSVRTVQLEPGRYTMEFWANPQAVEPSDKPFLPADGSERHCVVALDIEAGTHVEVRLDDVPREGECPHSVEAR